MTRPTFLEARSLRELGACEGDASLRSLARGSSFQEGAESQVVDQPVFVWYPLCTGVGRAIARRES
jgi:hypothetical protein